MINHAHLFNVVKCTHLHTQTIGGCRDDEFKCPKDYYDICYSNTYLCDTYIDCEDGYDENNCSVGEHALMVFHYVRKNKIVNYSHIID